jgi:hypothetical protein
MRRMFTLFAFIVMAISCSGQKSVEALFKKYANTDGFVTVAINGDLLKFLDNFDDEGADHHSFPVDVTEVRILAQEDEHSNVVNFYDQVIADLNRSEYDEFMRISKSDQKVIMFIRTEGRRIKEFLLVAGGKDNALIQVKGNLTMEDARKLSADFKEDHHMDLISKKN